MAFAGIFQPFARLRLIRFGSLMRDRKFSRRFSVPQTTALALLVLANRDDYFGRVFGLSGDNSAKARTDNIDSERLAASNVWMRPHSLHLNSTALSSRVVNGRCFGAKVEGRLRLRRPDSRQLCRGGFLDFLLPNTQRSLLKTNCCNGAKSA